MRVFFSVFCVLSLLCVLKWGKGVLFIALQEGHNRNLEVKQLERFGLSRCNGSFQTEIAQTVATVRVRFPVSRCAGLDSRVGAIHRHTIPVRPGSKRTGPAREPEPEPGLWLRGRRRLAGAGGARVRVGMVSPKSRTKTPSTQRAHPLFLFLSI